jgi:hypothetical protein
MKHRRMLADETLLLLGRELHHALNVVGVNRREDLSIHTEVRMIHMRGFNGAFKAERDSPKVLRSHIKNKGTLEPGRTMPLEHLEPYFFLRAMTTSSLPPSDVFPTVMPRAWNPSPPRSFASFCSVEVFDVAISL